MRIGCYDSGMADKSVFGGNRIMGQYRNEWGEISYTIEEHINLMMGRYYETGVYSSVFPQRLVFFRMHNVLGKC